MKNFDKYINEQLKFLNYLKNKSKVKYNTKSKKVVINNLIVHFNDVKKFAIKMKLKKLQRRNLRVKNLVLKFIKKLKYKIKIKKLMSNTITFTNKQKIQSSKSKLNFLINLKTINERKSKYKNKKYIDIKEKTNILKKKNVNNNKYYLYAKNKIKKEIDKISLGSKSNTKNTYSSNKMKNISNNTKISNTYNFNKINFRFKTWKIIKNNRTNNSIKSVKK